MISYQINNGINGIPVIPGDKSISHRSIIIPSISNGICEVTNILKSEDIQKQATYLMIIILSASSVSAILYFVETGPIKIFSAAFGLLAVAKLVKLFRLDWDR